MPATTPELQLDPALDELSATLDSVDARLGRIEQLVGKLDARLGRLETALSKSPSVAPVGRADGMESRPAEGDGWSSAG